MTIPLLKFSFKGSLIIKGIISLALVGAVCYYFICVAPFESTDDAAIEGRVIQIAPQVAGQVAHLLVTDNQMVKEGDLILEIDPRDYEAALAQAKANLDAAEAQSQYAKADSRRYASMGNMGVSQSEIDLAAQKARSAEAQVVVAKSAIVKAQLDVDHTKITAPCSGRVTKRSVERGDYVQKGQDLMAIVPPDYWVTADFKETQLEHMKPGQSVEIKIDAFPGRSFKGHVDSIQSGAGARFSLFPPENATGNFIKVVQRVPVKITFDSPITDTLPVGPGMSVEPVVRVR
jgi:membrane fusion protein (multidrug efflux system)